MTYFEFLGEHGPTLLMGATTTVKVLVCSTILYVIISMIFGLMRISKNPIIQGIATVYIEIFRGTSLLVQLFWFYYVLPFFGISLEAFVAGVLSLGMNFGAYGAEIVRGGILAVPKGQWEAAHALNFGPVKRIKRIIIPQIFPDCTATSCKSYSGTIKSYFISSSSYCC
jgi:polar amino acid transport system permease protein